MFASAILFLVLAQRPLAGPRAVLPDENGGTGQDANQNLSSFTHQAQEDFQHGRYREARQKLQRALRLSPRDPALWTYLGLTDEQLQDLDAATRDFQKALDILPGDAQSHFHLGRVLARKGDNVHAVEMYERGLKLDPNNLPANQNYALLLMKVGKFREAIVPLHKMRRINDSDLSTRAALIECYLKAAMPEEGMREIQEFLSAPHAMPEEKLALGKMLFEDKLSKFAPPILQQAVLELPASAEAHATLGLVLLEQNQYDDASRELKTAAQLAPDSPEYALHLSEALLLGKHYQEALDFLNSVHGKFGSLLEYRFKVGQALYGTRRYSQAIALLEALDREEPNLDLIQYYLGNSYNERGELDKAQAAYRKAISLNPNEATYYLVLAKALRKDGDDKTDEAITNLEKALKLDPGNVSSKQELALCYERKQDYGNAERLLQEVILQTPQAVSAHVALSRIYYRDQQKEKGDVEKKIIQHLEAQPAQ